MQLVQLLYPKQLESAPQFVRERQFIPLEWMQQIAHPERSRSSRISSDLNESRMSSALAVRASPVILTDRVPERSRSSRVSSDLNRSRLPSARASRVIATDLYFVQPVHLAHLQFERLSLFLTLWFTLPQVTQLVWFQLDVS